MMTNLDHNRVHPITRHLREAIEHLRHANRATVDDRREVTDLYDTLGALHSVIHHLPHLMAHLRWIVVCADADFYRHDDGSTDVAENLSLAEQALGAALQAVGQVNRGISEAWCGVAHLRAYDPDATDLV
jgi:hypothetical protein